MSSARFYAKVGSEKLRLNKQIEEARQRNALYSQPGTVRLQRQFHFRDKSVENKRWRALPGFRNISVSSGAKKWKVLSPLYLGPVEHEEMDGEGNALPPALSLEQLWRSCAVHKEDIGQDGKPNAQWHERRRDAFTQPLKSGKRRSGEAPIYWFWRGQQLGLIEARKEIYCHLYAALVVETELYRELNLLVQQGFNLQLFGYEAYDFIEQGKSLLEAIEDREASFGHEFVLYGLLTRDVAWTRNIPKA